MLFRLMIVLINSIFLFGCASENIALSPSQKSTLHNVSVNQEIKTPTNISYYDHAQMASLMGSGLLAYAIVNAVESGKKDRIKNALENTNPRIDVMLKQEFTEKLLSQTSYKLAENNFGDAQFMLEVNSYGFASEGFASNAAIPTLSVIATLVDANRNILWKSTQKAILEEEPYNSYSMAYYLNNPLIIHQAFQILTSEAAQNLIENLRSENE